MVRPIRQAHGAEALEGQAHHPEQGRRTDGVSKGEKRQRTPHRSSLGPNTGIQTPCSI
ncbi:MAG: hypothetical protein V3U06_11865 [Candidatus Binatia bacterium]